MSGLTLVEESWGFGLEPYRVKSSEDNKLVRVDTSC